MRDTSFQFFDRPDEQHLDLVLKIHGRFFNEF